MKNVINVFAVASYRLDRLTSGVFIFCKTETKNQELQDDIKARKVPPEELRGATITLSNFGTIAGRYATPIVVPPQVAILSAGRIAPRVVAADGEPAVHRTLPLSLTFDHRAVTGGEASRFLGAALADLELPD